VSGAWREEAACKGMDPDGFHPSIGGTTIAANAKAVCRSCPVMDECRAYAIAAKERLGIWGGTSPSERGHTHGPRRTSPCSGCGGTVARTARWCPTCEAERTTDPDVAARAAKRERARVRSAKYRESQAAETG